MHKSDKLVCLYDTHNISGSTVCTEIRVPLKENLTTNPTY